MNTPASNAPPEVSPYVPRGPVAHELHALRLSVIINNVTVILLAMFGAYFMVRAFGRVDSAADTAVKIQTLQQTQADNSTNGRALLTQLTAIGKVIAEQTSPTATAIQQQKIGNILSQLTDGIKTLNADQLRKLGQLAIVLGAPPATVNKILSEPVPTITFGPQPPVVNPSPAAAPSPSSVGSSLGIRPVPAQSPSRSPALNIQIQCPVICPQK